MQDRWGLAVDHDGGRICLLRRCFMDGVEARGG
jgi:hypothetical protein